MEDILKRLDMDIQSAFDSQGFDVSYPNEVLSDAKDEIKGLRRFPFTLPEIETLLSALKQSNGFRYGIDKNIFSSIKKLTEARENALLTLRIKS